MLNVVLLADANNSKILGDKLQKLDCKVVAIVAPNEYDANILQKYKADLIVTNPAMLTELSPARRKDKMEPRQQVKAVTHQGIRLVQVANVFYFQAEHKYVTAFHTQGQLLIEDSLNSLEKEFSDAFIRIHRKTLVAKNKIETLLKDDNDKYYVKLRGREEMLNVSRRQVTMLRKVLLWL